MLAEKQQAGLRAVKVKVEGQVAAHQRRLFVQADLCAMETGENPWVADGRTPDHDAVAARMRAQPGNIGYGAHIAVANDRHVNGALDFGNGIPIGGALVGLSAGAAMNGDEAGAAVFEDAGHGKVVAAIIVPTHADLAGHWNG